LQAVYQNNGFPRSNHPETSAVGVGNGEAQPAPVSGDSLPSAQKKIAPLNVIYRIEEGEQLRVGTVRIEGNEHVDAPSWAPELNTAARAVAFRPESAGDRDTC